MPGYAAAQTLGAFCGAAIVFVLNYQHIKKLGPTLSTTQGNFATYPADGLSNLTGSPT